MTDGHIQYNGGNWNFYASLQPALRCEFEDHRTCLTRSADFDAGLTQADADALELVKKNQAVEVEAAAANAAVNEQTARVNEAGRRKHEATRQNGLIKVNKLKDSAEKCSASLSLAQSAFEVANRTARATLDAETTAIVAENIAEQNEINATDFLTEVIEEEAVKAKAQTVIDAAAAKARAKADAETLRQKAQADAAQAIADEEAKEKAEADAAQLAQDAQDAADAAAQAALDSEALVAKEEAAVEPAPVFEEKPGADAKAEASTDTLEGSNLDIP